MKKPEKRRKVTKSHMDRAIRWLNPTTVGWHDGPVTDAFPNWGNEEVPVPPVRGDGKP